MNFKVIKITSNFGRFSGSAIAEKNQIFWQIYMENHEQQYQKSLITNSSNW